MPMDQTAGVRHSARMGQEIDFSFEAKRYHFLHLMFVDHDEV